MGQSHGIGYRLYWQESINSRDKTLKTCGSDPFTPYGLNNTLVSNEIKTYQMKLTYYSRKKLISFGAKNIRIIKISESESIFDISKRA